MFLEDILVIGFGELVRVLYGSVIFPYMYLKFVIILHLCRKD